MFILFVERMLRLLRATRSSPIVTCWLLAQLGAVLYFVYLAEVRGIRDHHFGMAMMAVMSVLLFPGSVMMAWIIGGGLGLLLDRVGAGHPPYFQSPLVGVLISLFWWATSAAVSWRFWTWVGRWFDRDSKPDMGWKWDPTPPGIRPGESNGPPEHRE